MNSDEEITRKLDEIVALIPVPETNPRVQGVLLAVLAIIILAVCGLTGVIAYRYSEPPPVAPLVEKIDTGESQLALNELKQHVTLQSGNVALALNTQLEHLENLIKAQQAEPKTIIKTVTRTVYVERKSHKPKPKLRKVSAKEVKKLLAGATFLPQSEVDKINAQGKTGPPAQTIDYDPATGATHVD